MYFWREETCAARSSTHLVQVWHLIFSGEEAEDEDEAEDLDIDIGLNPESARRTLTTFLPVHPPAVFNHQAVPEWCRALLNSQDRAQPRRDGDALCCWWCLRVGRPSS